MNAPKAILYALTLVALLATVSSRAVVAAQPTPEAPAHLWQTRAGLPHFFAKLRTGQEVSVAYFGGSITAASGWRVQTFDWLRKLFPQTKFREINAAIPGTGTTLGVYRLNQDMLQHKPDLLFIEFAVNDGGTPPDDIARATEGIVRQTKTANPQTDICFVYTFRTGHENFWSATFPPRRPQSTKASRSITSYLPSISACASSQKPERASWFIKRQQTPSPPAPWPSPPTACIPESRVTPCTQRSSPRR